MTHQSVRSYFVTFVSANPSFRSANCPYLSVRPVRFGVAVDPPIGSIGPSINLYTRPSRVTPPNCMRACVRAYLSNLFANLSHLSPRAFSLSLFLVFTLSFLPSFFLPPSHFIYLFIYLYPFAVVRLLPLRAHPLGSYTPPRSTYRTTYRAPVQLVLHSRESRESPGDSPRRDSLSRGCRAVAPGTGSGRGFARARGQRHAPPLEVGERDGD